MTDFTEHVHDANKITDWFGYWPIFHDAVVVWIFLSRGTPLLHGNVSIELLLHTWHLTDTIGANGYLEITKECLVHFRFVGCTDISVEGFDQKNELLSLQFSALPGAVPVGRSVLEDPVPYIVEHPDRVAGGNLEVAFVPASRLEGGFKCLSAGVVSVTPLDSGGSCTEPLPWPVGGRRRALNPPLEGPSAVPIKQSVPDTGK